MFIVYLWMIASASPMVKIARGLGGIYISSNFFEKMEQDTRVWVYILIWNIHFLHKNNASVAARNYYGFRWGGEAYVS